MNNRNPITRMRQQLKLDRRQMCHGADALLRRPLVTVGTIHSVKGGEADVVYLFPDLSYSGMREWVQGPFIRDPLIRMFYVALTRAREVVVLCGQDGRNAPQLPVG
ncbi:MAG: hypothetical protein Q8P50_06885 [Bacillota bacterium]|nr:hypothetical protein [Bacillota bacterium]